MVSARTALLSAHYVKNERPTDGWDWFTRLRTASSVLFTGPRIIVSYILHNFIESCNGECRYYTIDSEVSGLDNAKCSQRAFANHNLAIKFIKCPQIFFCYAYYGVSCVNSKRCKDLLSLKHLPLVEKSVSIMLSCMYDAHTSCEYSPPLSTDWQGRSSHSL